MKRHEKAKAWRIKRGLTPEQLETATGYSAIAIYWFERGETPPQRNAKGGNASNREIKEWVWKRWERACGDVDAEIVGRKKGQAFAW